MLVLKNGFQKNNAHNKHLKKYQGNLSGRLKKYKQMYYEMYDIWKPGPTKI